MARTRDSPGNRSGSPQAKGSPAAVFSCSNSDSVVISASHFESATRGAAAATAFGILSTARSVTQSKLSSKFSARCAKTFAWIPSKRTASCKKAAFLPCDSASVTVISGRQSAIGIPGNPAPEPKSSREAIPLGRKRATSMDSTKCREMIPSSSRIAERFTFWFQRINSER